MRFAVQLFFDGPLEAAVRRVWDEFSRNSVTSTLLEYDDHPHLTLAHLDEPVDHEALKRIASELARAVEPIPLRLTYYGAFPGTEGVVFLGPTPTQRLLALHQQVTRRLEEDGMFPQEHYKRRRWVPHVTVGQNVSDERMSAALELCREVELPLAGEARGIEVVSLRPTKSLAVHRFRAGKG